MTKEYCRNISILLALALILTLLPAQVFAAAPTSTEIGCYEYGYAAPAAAPTVEEYIPEGSYGGTGRVYHIAPSGSNGAGDGSAENPWQTLEYAAAQPLTPGDVLLLEAGTYYLTDTVSLAPGVSLLGEGSDRTVITLADDYTGDLTQEYTSLIRLHAEDAEEGRQQIAGICFDGNDFRAAAAMTIQNRDYVAVHDCIFRDFNWWAVGWRAGWSQNGAGDVGYDPPEWYQPTQYIIGGRFYNNTVSNCSGYDGWGRGALFCAGLKDFRIYGNTFTEQCTDSRMRGVPIKFWFYTGWMIGCKIHDNYIARLGSTTASSEIAGWAFAIESMYHAGMELCGNTFVGAVDLNNGYSGTFGGSNYEYSTWMHDNTFLADENKLDDFEEKAIILESYHEDVLIERNRIDNYQAALFFNMRVALQNVIFRYNACTDVGGSGGNAIYVTGIDQIDINGDGEAETVTLQINDFKIYNNLILSKPDEGCWGISMIQSDLVNQWIGSGIDISNNIISGFTNWLFLNKYSAIQDFHLENNIYYGNLGYSPTENAYSAPEGYIAFPDRITDCVIADNLGLENADGLFVSDEDFHPAAGSPAIERGKSYGEVFDLDNHPVGAVQVADYMPGDVDGDGAITARDVVVLRCYLAYIPVDYIHLAAADVDGSPGVTAGDVIVLRRYMAHWEGVSLAYATEDAAKGMPAKKSASTAKLQLSSAAGKVGDEVTLTLAMVNNPGIVTMLLDIEYDPSQLELVSTADTYLLSGGLFTRSINAIPYALYWDDSLAAQNNTANGVIATLTFRILEDCDRAEITIVQRRKSTLNWAMQDVLFQIENGTITRQTDEEQPPVSENPFKDVKTTDWFYGAVQFATERNLMNGTSAEQFNPQKMTNRAMIATILWRMDGSPSVDYDMSFQDVPIGKWYTEAIRWAQMNGLVNGYNNDKFGTTNPITREQMATILYRYAKSKGKVIDADDFVLEFTDAGKVSTWADQAVRWCVREGFLNGKGSGILDPKGQAKRCEVAAILQRFMEKMDI